MLTEGLMSSKESLKGRLVSPVLHREGLLFVQGEGTT